MFEIQLFFILQQLRKQLLRKNIMSDNTTPHTTPHIFQIGDRVERIEDRVEVSATVISISTNEGGSGLEGEAAQSVEISYDEGGSGWWPSSCLRLLLDE